METEELRSKRTCPVCGRTYTEPPAISRRSKGMEICPECGTREAIEDWNRDQEERMKERTKTHASDLISRHEAIEVINHELRCGAVTDQCGLETAHDLIEKLPPAQPEQRWIPCCERLPEESGYYIVTAHDGVGHRTTFVKYQKKAKSWDLTGARSYWRVIAWMPLPEPYKGGEKDG